MSRSALKGCWRLRTGRSGSCSKPDFPPGPDFQDDLLHCKELSLEDYDTRSAWHKFKESVSRLLSPIL